MGWTASLTQKCLLFVIGFFVLIYLAFPGNVYSIEWILAAAFIVVIIMLQINRFSQKERLYSDMVFINRIFWGSMAMRVMSMMILWIIAQNTEGWDMFYYVGAKDPQKYYRVAWEASVLMKNFNISEAYQHIYQSYSMDISDTGFSSFLSILILLFGLSPIIIELILCTLGSLLVVRGYKLALLLFEKRVARLAAIFLMFYPISWFYSAVLLKEGLMVLLIIEALIVIVILQRSFSLPGIFKGLVLIILLFFFRSAISILLAGILLFSLFMSSKKKQFAVNILVAAIILGGYIYFLKSTGRYEEYYTQYTETEEYNEGRINYMQTVNPYVAIAGTPVFAALSFVTPFPSIVKIPVDGGLSHNEYYYHVAGNIFWILLAFFSFYGVFISIRYHTREMAPIWTFILGYQFVLLRAMMFTSVRFSYPVKPLLLIMAAYGIYQMKKKKWYPVYLIGSIIMIIGWNYIRLKGKG